MIGQILSIGEKIIDKVIPDPTERAKAKAALLEQQQKENDLKLENLRQAAKMS